MAKRRFLSLAVMIFFTLTVLGQIIPNGYNPFIPANLDDPAKLPVVPVVESSYHRYWVNGDQKYTDPSSFVWYVENGSFGTFDSLTDTWTPVAIDYALGSGRYTTLTGTTIDSINNSSEIWVRWNDGSAAKTGYIAVAEVSADSCYIPDQLSGFKHPIVSPPEMWFIVGNLEECSDQDYSVTVQFNNVNDYSYPYTFRYSYPGNDGVAQTGELQINASDLDGSLMYTFDLIAIQDLNVALDETYLIALERLRDKYGSTGKIAPLGVAYGQYQQIGLTIHHLPQTGGMTMD